VIRLTKLTSNSVQQSFKVKAKKSDVRYRCL
jgi:hypothetical protein